jgi:hypothetical protein
MKACIITFLILINTTIAYAGICGPGGPIVIPDDPEPPKPNTETTVVGPSNTITGLNGIISTFTNPLTGLGNRIQPAGDWGLDNFSLSGNYDFTSFDNVASSGHFRSYSITLTGNVTESDVISLGVSNTRYETGGATGILARTNGISTTWIHNLNENYGIGVLGLLNDVDIEEINGNSYSYAYGVIFTTFHDLGAFTLSSATTIAHTEFDTGYDQLFLSAWTASKFWTDSFGSYLTLTVVDSLKSDPDGDPTYGTWELGAIYIFDESFSISAGFSRT